MSRFIAIPARLLTAQLDDIGKAVVKAGGSARWWHHGREKVYDIVLPGWGAGHFKAIVRVYTSIALGADTVRDCGTDAIRIVVGYEREGDFRPLEKGTKILRTAPRGAPAKRLEHFFDRFRSKLRDAYLRARRTPACPKCASPMKRRKSVHGEFYGCVGYPDCKTTRNITKAAS